MNPRAHLALIISGILLVALIIGLSVGLTTQPAAESPVVVAVPSVGLTTQQAAESPVVVVVPDVVTNAIAKFKDSITAAGVASEQAHADRDALVDPNAYVSARADSAVQLALWNEKIALAASAQAEADAWAEAVATALSSGDANYSAWSLTATQKTTDAATATSVAKGAGAKYDDYEALRKYEFTQLVPTLTGWPESQIAAIYPEMFEYTSAELAAMEAATAAQNAADAAAQAAKDTADVAEYLSFTSISKDALTLAPASDDRETTDADIVNGVYTLINVGNGLALQLNTTDIKYFVDVGTYTGSGNTFQYWKISWVSGQTYMIWPYVTYIYSDNTYDLLEKPLTWTLSSSIGEEGTGQFGRMFSIYPNFWCVVVGSTTLQFIGAKNDYVQKNPDTTRWKLSRVPGFA